ncbi:hypothetical protein [Streptomyces europaeiscabiei]|uniref:hypothetical protein n=1 Tax=Streptomyces europaeiscabiei TaxID=146819 RepID=UPI002E2D6AA1|nr:hypothetical protein [Streptomyces europaeiscabiei]
MGPQELPADAHGRLEGGDRHDLLDVRRALDTVRSDLPAFRQQASDRIRARLDALDPTAEDRAQVLRCLETNDLAPPADLCQSGAERGGGVGHGPPGSRWRHRGPGWGG